MGVASRERGSFFARAQAALTEAALSDGVNLSQAARCEAETGLLIPTLAPPQIERLFADLDEGAGNPRGDLTSAMSSALLAANAFAVFEGRSHADAILRVTLASPRFERKFPVQGVQSGAAMVPNFDVVQVTGDRAVAVESKLLEPWRGKPRFEISAQYEGPAERFSSGLRGEIDVIRDGHYELLDAAQAVKHLLGLASALVRPAPGMNQPLPEETALVLLHWEPLDAENEPLVEALHDEADRFRDRVGEGPIGVQLLGYRELWEAWQRPTQPAWLREHGATLARRYAVTVGTRTPA